MAATRATAAALLAFGVLGAAGCGGDEDGAANRSSRPASLAERPTPNQPIVAQTPPFNRALARHDCREYQPLVLSFVRGRAPGAPATAKECRQRDTAFEYLRGDRMDRAAQYGTGGLMEGPGPANGRKYTVWALDGDRRFRYANVSGIGPAEAGTPFSQRKHAARVATRFLGAVRSKDCPTMERLFSPKGSRLVANLGSARAACRAVLKGEFLAPALRRTPDPGVEVLGGTQNLAFVGVATRRIYFTMMLGGGKERVLRVFDVVPSTPVKLPKG